MKNVVFRGDSLAEIIYWAHHDTKILDKIHSLLKDISRNGAAAGVGKPERLKYGDGRSRRITKDHRLVYDVDDKNIYVFSCKGHYE